MFCPVCHAEFIPGFTVCDECGVELVDELPAESPRGKAAVNRLSGSAPGDPAAGSRDPSASRPVELVTVFRSGDSGMVALVKSVLTSAGIPFADSWAVFGGGGAVRVDREDAADALALLAELEASADEPESDLLESDFEEWDEDEEQPGTEKTGVVPPDERATETDAAPASSPTDDRGGQPSGGETSPSPGVGAPSPPTAPTPPPGIDPPAWRG